MCLVWFVVSELCNWVENMQTERAGSFFKPITVQLEVHVYVFPRLVTVGSLPAIVNWHWLPVLPPLSPDAPPVPALCLGCTPLLLVIVQI